MPVTLEHPNELARQTAQAKALREARDELAAAVAKLAEKKDRKALKGLGIEDARIKALLDGAKFNSEDLADLLGVSLLTLRGWMAPADNSSHRGMPKTAALLLARILSDGRDT